MKNKVISFLLIFMFFFGVIADSYKKEAEAFSIAAGFGIAKVIGILLGGATLVAGGYVIGDNAINPEENSDFTNWVTGEYLDYIRNGQNLPGAPPPSEHELTAMEQMAVNSLLTSQGFEVGSDLYNQLYDYYYENYVKKYIPEPEDIAFTRDVSYTSVFDNYSLPDNGEMFGTQLNTYDIKYEWKPQYLGQIMQLNLRYGPLDGRTVYVEFLSEMNSPTGTWKTYWQKARLISEDNSTAIYTPNLYSGLNSDLTIGSGRTSYLDTGLSITLGDYVPEESNYPDIVTPPDNMVSPEEYTPTFKNFDMSPLNGLVSSQDEMLGIINGSIQVSPQRYQAIEDAWNEVLRRYLQNPNFQGSPDTPEEPTTNPTTGLLDFGDIPTGPILDPEAIPDDLNFYEKAIYWLKGIWYAITEIPKGIINGLNRLYNLLSTWFNQFWTKVDTLIDDFWMSFTDWWQDNFIYHWTTFQNYLQGLWDGLPDLFAPLFESLLAPFLGLPDFFNNIWEDLQLVPGYLLNIWEWLLGLPDFIYDLFVPEPDLIADTWEPFIILWHDRIDPIISPFQNIGFYATEYEDVTVDLQFNNVGGTFKILDYQYVKNYREPVKNILRSFFWILIIFFNLDQVHRLIRNQSIIKTYVRKVEQPGGKD